MIIELLHSEPDTGRHYVGLDGQSVPALERVRFDTPCVKYTKVTGADPAAVREKWPWPDQAPVSVWYAPEKTYKWVEAIAFIYQTMQGQNRGILAFGAQLVLYGTGPEPTTLTALRGAEVTDE